MIISTSCEHGGARADDDEDDAISFGADTCAGCADFGWAELSRRGGGGVCEVIGRRDLNGERP